MRPLHLAPVLLVMAAGGCEAVATGPAAAPQAALPQAAYTTPAMSLDVPAAAAPAVVATPAATPSPSAPGAAAPPAITPDLSEAPPGTTLAEAAAQVRHREWRKARQTLSADLPVVEVHGSLEEILAAHALLGRACAETKDAKCADDHYARVVALWNIATALGAQGDAAAREARTASALAAVGEAFFHAAEEKRAEADKIAFPVYAGAGSREDVLRFTRQKMGDWIQKKVSALQDADRAYVEVSRLQPAGLARWVIAAAERDGTMWDGFVRDVHRAPVPAAWKSDSPVAGASGLTYKEVREEYVKSLDASCEPRRVQARAAFAKCRELSTKSGIADDHTRACDAWLSANP